LRIPAPVANCFPLQSAHRASVTYQQFHPLFRAINLSGNLTVLIDLLKTFLFEYQYDGSSGSRKLP